MQRLRLYDLRRGRLPGVVGLCQSDISSVANIVNSAQRRLLMCKEACDEGWWGTWAEIAFNVSRTQPYITLPREVARLQFVDVCDGPIAVNNQFFEYLQFGNGRLPKTRPCTPIGSQIQGMARNNYPTTTDLTNGPQILRAYLGNAADAGQRIFYAGQDSNNRTVYTQDFTNRVTGQFVVLDSPFADAPQQWNRITGIQKDVTSGIVEVYQVDPTSGEEILLVTMQPTETTAWYRRYYFDQLPCSCCGTCPEQTLTVTAIAKLDLIPVRVDTDYLLLQNEEAIIEECQSVRLSEMDTANAKAMAQERHIQAVRLLNGELNHYNGKDQVAVNFAPFGSADLNKVMVGRMI